MSICIGGMGYVRSEAVTLLGGAVREGLEQALFELLLTFLLGGAGFEGS